MLCSLATVTDKTDDDLFVADASGTTATAYWESGTLISAAVETSSDVYILEVCSASCYFCITLALANTQHNTRLMAVFLDNVCELVPECLHSGF